MRTVSKTALAMMSGACALVVVAGCSSSAKHTAANSPAPGTSGSVSVASTPPSSSSPAPSGATSSSISVPPFVGPTGGPVPAGFTPSSVTFVSPTHGWVLGTAPCAKQPCTSIVRTRDGGHSWIGIPAPKAFLTEPNSPRDGGVSVLRFADDRDGWAGDGDLWSTHDGGASWHQQSTTTFSGRVVGLGTGGGYVYVATYNCPSEGSNSCSTTSRVYASPVGRDAWTPVTGAVAGGGAYSPLTVQGNTWFLSTRDGIWHGSGLSGGQRVANPCGGDAAASLAAADATHLDAICISGGAAGSASYQLYGTTDGGHTWRRTGPSHVEPSGLSGMADNRHGVLLLATQSGASSILRTTDDGGSFHPSQLSAPSGGYPWADLGFTTTTQAVVVLLHRALYLSHDAGASFAPVRF